MKKLHTKLKSLGGMMLRNSTAASFLPVDLFTTSAATGVWYDPSDTTTLFQDAAGTIPVTGTEQPVGLMLDKRLGLVRGAELASGLTPFSDASGTTTHTESAITTTGVLGGVTLPLTVGNWYALSATGGTSATELSINTANLAINPTAMTVIRTTIGDCVFLADKPFLYIRQSGAGTGTVNSLSLKELPGNHASQHTASKRPILQESGGLYSLKFDGVDDFMSTAAIDFSGTDKLSAWAGVTKLNDTARIVAELSATATGNSGSFFLASGTDSGYSQAYTSISRGTASATPGQIAGYVGVPAPDTAALTITHDISGDLSTIKRNGVAGVNGTFNKGAGNFGNYPLYIASRAGTSLFFNGNLYPLVIAGALYDADTVAKMNAWTAKKTGVTI